MVTTNSQSHKPIIVHGLVVPADWDDASVVVPGLLSDDRINETKVSEFINLSYSSTKDMFRSRFDYFFFFENSTSIVPIAGEEYFGKPGITPDNLSVEEDPTQVLKVVRLAVYNQEIVRMEVFIWE